MNYIDEYIEYLKYQRNYSKHTYDSYKDMLNKFNDYLTQYNITLTNFTYEDVKNYLRKLDKKKLSRSSICKNISILKSFYKYLFTKNYISSNPFYTVSLPKKEKKLPKFIYYNELEDLFSKPDLNSDLGIRNRLILELLYATGIRISELVNIKISNINFSNKSIKVLGKGKKERIVYYGDYAKEYLELYLKKCREKLIKKNNDYLILNNNGNKITERGVALIINNIIKKTNIKTKISPHTFRHTFATHLLNEGCDILTVQQLLGHESLKATQIYTHITDDRLKDVYLHCHPRANKKDK